MLLGFIRALITWFRYRIASTYCLWNGGYGRGLCVPCTLLMIDRKEYCENMRWVTAKSVGVGLHRFNFSKTLKSLNPIIAVVRYVEVELIIENRPIRAVQLI